jgi:hypothetical protein
VSYKELVEIVRTGFVNPNLDALGVLRKLELDAEDVFRYFSAGNFTPMTALEKEAVDARLEAMTAKYARFAFDATQWLNEAHQNHDFDRILVLADPDAGCSFDQTTLRYANGDPVDALALLRINLFVRLWRKLGWSIEDTDRALQAFLPQNALPLTAANIGQAMQTALVYLAHLKELERHLKIGKQSWQKLLTLWTNLPTTGKNPLYAQLFLTQSVLKQDLVFDHPLGQYLASAAVTQLAESADFTVSQENVAPAASLDPDAFAAELDIHVRYDEARQVQWLTYHGILLDPKKAQLEADFPSLVLAQLLDAVQVKAAEFVLVKGHLVALQGALNLSADEIRQILADANLDLETAALSLPHVSLLYRYGLLAKTLNMSVRDLITLKRLSGLEPLKPLLAGPLATLADDYPFSQTLRFVEVATQVKASGFTMDDLDYLLHHRFDPIGSHRADPAMLLALVKTLADGIRRIQSEHALPTDTTSLTDEALRQKMALVFAPEVVEAFLAMLAGTVEFEVNQIVDATHERLDPAKFAAERAIRLRFDPVRQAQFLAYRGVLVDAEVTRLTTTLNLATQAQTDMLAALLAKVQAETSKYFDFAGHFVRSDAPLQGFFEATDFDTLFAPITGATDEARQQQLTAKRSLLVNAFLPYLQSRLTQQLIVQTLTPTLNAEAALVEALLTDTGLLADPSQAGTPLVAAFAAIATAGVSSSFFAAADGTGAALASPTLAAVETRGKPNGTNSADFAGYLEVPAAGAYRFFIVCSAQNSQVELRFSHLTDPLIRATAAQDGDEFSNFIELQPGLLYGLSLTARNLNGGDVQLLVQSDHLPKGALDQLTLYPQREVERLARGQVLLAKVIQLIQGLALSEREVRHLFTHRSDFANLDLSTLPTREGDPAGVTFVQFLRLLDYMRLRQVMAGGGDDLIDLFELARRNYPTTMTADAAQQNLLGELYKRLAAITRREAAIVEAAALQLGLGATTTNPNGSILVEAPGFASEVGLWRLWEILQLVARLGVPVEALARWATPNPDVLIARDVKDTVKARFEQAAWQRVAQSIYDKLRQRQRDALVAWLLHHLRYERLEQLYEHLLIDPGTEPVVQTSRLRLAISSVQLFVQRCLLNLEKRVHPSAINAAHWQWMKRYRVWEANRKIFLFAENWLEPEFRDDKTHLFQEMEGALLQGDVSSELVEDAFFNYLKKLEELARLELVTMHLEEKPLDPAANVLHVIGRTFNTPHKYFYRRYSRQMWTPWEPVEADIQGDHLAAVMWRDRLHLFWVTFMEKASANASPSSPTDSTPVASLSLGSLTTRINAIVAARLIDMQLNWVEYSHGQWQSRESSQLGGAVSISAPTGFDSRTVAIYVSKETEDGEETALRIHLGTPVNHQFRVVSKHSAPQVQANSATEPPSPYPASTVQATQRIGSGQLVVTFTERIKTPDNKTALRTSVTKPILQQQGNFALLTCNNPIIVNSSTEDGALLGPVFYQDQARPYTFFIEPSLTVKTFHEWDTYEVSTGGGIIEIDPGPFWEDLPIYAETPELILPIDPGDPIPFDFGDPYARFKGKTEQDWATNPATVLQYGETLLGKSGGLNLETRPVADVASRVDQTIHVHPGSQIGVQETLAVSERVVPGAAMDVAQIVSSGAVVIGDSGLNALQAETLHQIATGFDSRGIQDTFGG